MNDRYDVALSREPQLAADALVCFQTLAVVPGETFRYKHSACHESIPQHPLLSPCQFSAEGV